MHFVFPFLLSSPLYYSASHHSHSPTLHITHHSHEDTPSPFTLLFSTIPYSLHPSTAVPVALPSLSKWPLLTFTAVELLFLTTKVLCVPSHILQGRAQKRT